ncbi:MAG: hypothetical protein JF615_05880, partial [Asticcacaulis sp.]|nr:hypothetical protein [Asticcacaulis sp.]
MRFKKTLLAIGAIGFGLLVFVAFNSKKSPPVMPARTVHLAVASESEAAFVEAVRTYATVKQMGFVDRPDSPGAIVILLQAKDEHINVTRYDAKMPVSAGFYRTGGWL